MIQKEREFINELIKKVFNTKKTQFKKTELDGTGTLLRLKILKVIKELPGLLELDTNSLLFNQSLLDLAKAKIGRKISNNISDAFALVDEFEEELKKDNNIKPNVIGSYSSLLKGLKGFVLIQLERSGVDVAKFYKGIIEPNQKRENQFFLFDDSFFRFLPHSGYDTKKILEICDEVLDKGDSHYVLLFARDLSKTNILLARQLYGDSSQISALRNSLFRTNLAIGLHAGGEDGIFGDFEKILETNLEEGYRFFDAIELKSKKVLNRVFRLAEKGDNEEAYPRRSNILRNIINNPLASKTMRAKCFKKIKGFFQCKNDGIAHSVIWSVEFIDGYEEGKTKLLIAYLNRTSNFKILDNFFFRFKEPSHLFKLIKSCYRIKWGRNSINIFEKAILHFWSENQKRTQEEILILFEPGHKFGMLPVEIIMCGYSVPFPVDLLKLKTEEKQLKAIDCFCLFPHSLDSLLPILLDLRKSSFSSVRIYLQEMLSELIVHSYRKILFESLEELLKGNKNDRKFFEPFKKAFDVHKEVENMKASVNDLNPHENEKKLMDLYYRLEHERRAKMMDGIGKGENSFLGSVKNTVIVRGNSWKIDGREDVAPLGHVKTEHWLDARAYKNPDLFEFNLNNFDK